MPTNDIWHLIMAYICLNLTYDFRISGIRLWTTFIGVMALDSMCLHLNKKNREINK